MMFAPNGRKADTTIAEKDRGHAVPGRGRQLAVPGRLAVVVGVHIHPARRYQQTIGVDIALCGAGLAADLSYAVAVDRHVAHEAVIASAIKDGPTTDNRIVHGRSLLDFVVVQQILVETAGQGERASSDRWSDPHRAVTTRSRERHELA